MSHVCVPGSRTEMPTARQIMNANRGVGPGFDTLRLALAVIVLLMHSISVSYGPPFDAQFWQTPFFMQVHAALLPMFFALSGFLVTSSALRTARLDIFLAHRALRIVPALFTEVMLTVFILGPLLTTWALSDYFASPLVRQYFLNIVGSVHFYLPGLFETNPVVGVVNVNLWTLRPEFYCYICMSAIMASGIVRSPRNHSILALIGTAAYVAYLSQHQWGQKAGGPLAWHVLVYAFLLGSVAYHWSSRIVIDGRLCIAASILTYAALSYPPATIIALGALTYCMIYLGMVRLPMPAWLKGRDISYGIYLYGFPMQQTIVFLLPKEAHAWWIVFPIALVTATAFSILSWHAIEKPTLGLKKFLKSTCGTAVQRSPDLGSMPANT